ncbi:transposase [Caproiciproducens sp. R1]|uniref:transposase n=1 Tax=Caproiciproducens sp. R1 TaxID=3435000 RepID=UPI004034905D
MKKRFSEEQIIRFLKEHESEKKLQILFENTIFLNTIYRWKSKYSGMDVSEAKHLKQLEEENRQLKELVANLTLGNHILKNVLAKNA